MATGRLINPLHDLQKTTSDIIFNLQQVNAESFQEIISQADTLYQKSNYSWYWPFSSTTNSLPFREELKLLTQLKKENGESISLQKLFLALLNETSEQQTLYNTCLLQGWVKKLPGYNLLTELTNEKILELKIFLKLIISHNLCSNIQIPSSIDLSKFSTEELNSLLPEAKKIGEISIKTFFAEYILQKNKQTEIEKIPKKNIAFIKTAFSQHVQSDTAVKSSKQNEIDKLSIYGAVNKLKSNTAFIQQIKIGQVQNFARFHGKLSIKENYLSSKPEQQNTTPRKK